MLPASVATNYQHYLESTYRTPFTVEHYEDDDDETTAPSYTPATSSGLRCSKLDVTNNSEFVIADRAEGRSYFLIWFSPDIADAGPTEPWIGPKDQLTMDGHHYLIDSRPDRTSYNGDISRYLIIWRKTI